jgi:membrane protease YdiL (CAAX protease family)
MLVASVVAAVLIIRFRWGSLRSAPTARGLPPEACFALALALFVAGPLALRGASSIGLVELPAATDATMTVAERAHTGLYYYVGQVTVALAYVWVCLATARRRGPLEADRRPGLARAAAVGVAAIVLGWPIVSTVGAIVATVAGWLGADPPDPIAHDTLRAMLEGEVDLWFVVLVGQVVVIAPITEELLYRGLVQPGLRGLGVGRWAAITTTSVVFAAMHWQNTAPHAVVALFALSLAFGWAYERTGRLAAPIVMHMLFNLGNLTVAHLTH